MNKELIIEQLEILREDMHEMAYNRIYDRWYSTDSCRSFEEYMQGSNQESLIEIYDRFNYIIQSIKES